MNFKRAFLTLMALMLLPGLAMAQPATFTVDLDFLDGNDLADTTARISCTDGLPLENQQGVSDGSTIIFVLTFPDGGGGNADCTITVDAVSGYTAEYLASGDSGLPTPDLSLIACRYVNVDLGHANLCEIDMVPKTTARFETSMVFTDDNPVDTSVVHRECNNGLPLNQFFELGHLDFVEFIAELLPAGEEFFSCTITAADVPNYSTWYSELGVVFTTDPCDYTRLELDAVDWVAECHIKMVPELAEVTVSKDWDTVNTGGEPIKFDATIIASSSDEDAIPGSSPCENRYCLSFDFIGENPSDEIFFVKAGYLGESILLTEVNQDSSVEITNNCGGSVRVFPGSEASCGFVNTVFFEGIPTLSQYGLAIMALLMLGVGFVGFRRFV